MMWGKKHKNKRDNGNSGGALHLTASTPKAWRNKIFMMRLGLTILVALAGFISAGILCWLGTRSMGQYLLFQNDLFKIGNVRIDCDGEALTPKYIGKCLELNACSNIFAFNMQAKRSALMDDIPCIKSVEISRRLPGELDITVHERLPVARLEMNAYYLTVDREGRVLGTTSGSKILPVISGHAISGLRPGVQLDEKKIRRALAVIQTCDTMPVGNYVKIMRIDVHDQDMLSFILADGEQVKFSWIGMTDLSPDSPDNLERKLSRLAESLRSASTRGKKIASIDLTVENNFPAIEY